MNNRIPRKFNRITGEMLIETNHDKPGDVLHIYKNDCSTGYLALNNRTKKYAYVFVSMLRNTETFKLISIE